MHDFRRWCVNSKRNSLRALHKSRCQKSDVFPFLRRRKASAVGHFSAGCVGAKSCRSKQNIKRAIGASLLAIEPMTHISIAMMR